MYYTLLYCIVLYCIALHCLTDNYRGYYCANFSKIVEPQSHL